MPDTPNTMTMPTQPPREAHCARCEQLLPAGEFSLRNASSGKRRGVCRSCINVLRSAIEVRNRAFVAEVNARTVCAHCGAQPIEWHNPEHVELNRQTYRISSMVHRCRTIIAIQAEMERCTPLCRRCHMKEDGRLKTFLKNAAATRAQAVRPASPCSQCGRYYKPLRKTLCTACYARGRVPSRQPGYVPGKHSPNKLKREDAAQIRRYYVSGWATMQELSRLYAVAYSTIRQIVRGKRWKDPLVEYPAGGLARGEKNGMARLNEDAVRAIREDCASGQTQQAVASAFGVAQTTVWAIIHRRKWAHVL